MKSLFTPILTSMLLSTLAFSAEIDQFTLRYEPLEDMSPILNKRANQYLQESIQKYNSQNTTCHTKADEIKFYELLKNYFSNHKHGKLVQNILNEKNFVIKRELLLKDSIYGGFDLNDGYLLARKSAQTSPLALGKVIGLKNHAVGSDKFEHLFGQGNRYFTEHYLEGDSMDEVLKSSEWRETWYLGGSRFATGVYSYGDLSANFNGMRFWNDLFAKRPDILGETNGPFIKCEKGRIKQVKQIDFNYYLDDATDEGINCSKFATKEGLNSVLNKIEALAKEDPSHQYTCPVDLNKVTPLLKKYGIYGKRILNIMGHMTQDE